MNFLLKAIKSEPEPDYTFIDSISAIECKIDNAKLWLKQKLKKNECRSPGCHCSPEGTSLYCKWHKCHNCDSKRAPNKFNCATHS